MQAVVLWLLLLLLLLILLFAGSVLSSHVLICGDVLSRETEGCGWPAQHPVHGLASGKVPDVGLIVSFR